MSSLYDSRFDRKKYGNYNKHKNFISVIGGTDAYFLEDEYNEMQWIQNEENAETLRFKYHSGIVEKTEFDDLILQPDDSFKPNLFSFKKMKSLINGYLLNISGNLGALQSNVVIKQQNINNVILPEPPEYGSRYDFVYLKMWFSEIKFDEPIWYNGNKDNYNGVINNDLFDPRINGETCRRAQLQWQIDVAAGIDFTKNPFGFDNKLVDGTILANPGKGVPFQYSFWRSDLNLDNNDNFNDKGLWVAGKGIAGEMETIDGYIYAIPLFRIKRRNINPYDLNNPDGSDLFDSTQLNVSSRPDGKFANIIYKDDIEDLRNLICVDCIDYGKILQRNYIKLVTGELQSKQKPKVITEIFGIDPIIPTANTKVYVGFNNVTNNITTNINKVPLEVNNINYTFVPGVEQQAAKINNKGYFKYDIDATITTGYVTMMLKRLDYNNIDLWSFLDATNKNVLSCSIINNVVTIKDSTSTLLTYSLVNQLNVNEFSHIAVTWSKVTNYIYLIINGQLVSKMDILNKLVSDNLKYFILCYNSISGYGCQNIILDEIEYSTQVTTSYGTLPPEFINGTAKLCIDTQKGRRLYLNTPSKTTMTEFLTFTSNADGTLNFSLNAPTGGVFNSTSPTVYYDNEAVLANVNWNGFGTNKLTANISGLGNKITYNLVINYEVEFADNQGLHYCPQKVYKVTLERLNDPCFAVRADKNFETYPINNISSTMLNTVNMKDKLCIYKYDLTQKLGFIGGIKYHLKGNNSNTITIPKKIYGYDITTVYDANIVDSLTDKNLVTNFKYDTNNITITLSKSFTSSSVIELLLGTTIPGVVYNDVTSGIENLMTVEKVTLIGDSKTTEFPVRFEGRILNSLGSIINRQPQFIAYVNGIPQTINVTFLDTFAKFKFNTAPTNKSNILIYVVREYEPIRSERIKIMYEAITYQGINDANYLNSIKSNDIIYYLDSIFVMTEGKNNPLDTRLNKNNINSVFLPIIDDVDSKLVPTPLIGDATNIKLNIDYVIMNDNDFNNSVPLLNQLKIQLSPTKILRGFTGYITVDNSSLCSGYQIAKSIPHLNVIPLLVKDNNDKLIMVVITSYKEDRDIKIDSNYNCSAIDIFYLDENILVK